MRGNTRASSWSCKIAPRGGEAAATAGGVSAAAQALLRRDDRVLRSEIGQYLGHSSESVTYRVYARFSPTYQRKAASVLE
jgi:integrase